MLPTRNNRWHRIHSGTFCLNVCILFLYNYGSFCVSTACAPLPSCAQRLMHFSQHSQEYGECFFIFWVGLGLVRFLPLILKSRHKSKSCFFVQFFSSLFQFSWKSSTLSGFSRSSRKKNRFSQTASNVSRVLSKAHKYMLSETLPLSLLEQEDARFFLPQPQRVSL